MKVDYIIVGFGLAGMAFAAKLEKSGKSFVVFDNNANRPTRVVGGMYNPIILKRFTPAWKIDEMWTTSLPFYKEMEKKFDKQYIYPYRIRRILHNTEEQNNWMVASDKAIMSKFMLPKIIKEEIKGINAPFGYGELKDVGRVKGEILLEDYKKYLIEKKIFLQESFDYSILTTGSILEYKKYKATKIVFSEGSYLHQNPFFSYLPMKEAKGEILLIKVPDLDINYIIKSGVFMVPFGKNTYMVGATYNWDDKTFDSTEAAQKEIETKLKKFLNLPYTIASKRVGIRPTISDRRPLLGIHPKYENMAVLNGLGTRGIIIAPSISNTLYEHLENNKTIPKEMDCKRFEK